MNIEQIKEWVKARMTETDPGHDWSHVERVWRNAMTILESEGGNEEIVSLTALLHDAADSKFFDEEKALGEIHDLLINANILEKNIEHITKIISHMSYSKGLEGEPFDSPEYRIVQDADRLDAMGAIGIARAFTYGAIKNRLFFNPRQAHQDFTSTSDYKKSTTPTINHFYEKLLLLKDLMKTKTGREMAEERHQFMKSYLDQFYKEWEGR